MLASCASAGVRRMAASSSAEQYEAHHNVALRGVAMASRVQASRLREQARHISLSAEDRAQREREEQLERQKQERIRQTPQLQLGCLEEIVQLMKQQLAVLQRMERKQDTLLKLHAPAAAPPPADQ